MLTQREYLAKRGVVCPFCGSDDIEGGSVDIDAGGAFQSISCNTCGREWQDTYRLDGFLAYDKDGKTIEGAEGCATTRVVVEVSGGVVTCVASDEPIELHRADYDNIGEAEDEEGLDMCGGCSDADLVGFDLVDEALARREKAMNETRSFLRNGGS